VTRATILGRDDDAQETEDARGRVWPPIPDAALPRDIFIPRLDRVRERGNDQWVAECPAHPDSTPSLSVTETDQHQLLVHCFGGCGVESVCESLGLSVCHLFPTAYALRRSGSVKATLAVRAHSPVVDPDVTVDPKFDRLNRAFQDHPERARKLRELGEQLGVPSSSLRSLGIGWSDAQDGRWSIPEHDDEARLVGIAYRHTDGQKTSASGGRRGLIVPKDLSASGTLYIAEGMSDAAAMLAAGRRTIGRPAAFPSALVRAWLARYVLAACPSEKVIVVADRDDAGREGALDLSAWLADECRRAVRWALPKRGFKDVRAQWLASESVSLVLQTAKS